MNAIDSIDLQISAVFARLMRPAKPVLKSCPFCGGEDVTIEEAIHEIASEGTLYHAMCGDTFCRASGPMADTNAKAVELWNTRA